MTTKASSHDTDDTARSTSATFIPSSCGDCDTGVELSCLILPSRPHGLRQQADIARPSAACERMLASGHASDARPDRVLGAQPVRPAGGAFARHAGRNPGPRPGRARLPAGCRRPIPACSPALRSPRKRLQRPEPGGRCVAAGRTDRLDGPGRPRLPASKRAPPVAAGRVRGKPRSAPACVEHGGRSRVSVWPCTPTLPSPPFPRRLRFHSISRRPWTGRTTPAWPSLRNGSSAATSSQPACKLLGRRDGPKSWSSCRCLAARACAALAPLAEVAPPAVRAPMAPSLPSRIWFDDRRGARRLARPSGTSHRRLPRCDVDPLGRQARPGTADAIHQRRRFPRL